MNLLPLFLNGVFQSFPFSLHPQMLECLEGDRSIDDVGLAAGRTQREKKRSYKDLLREEEEIAAQVRKTSKKRLKVRKYTSDLLLGLGWGEFAVFLL